ncbi:MAG: transcriptional activator of cad operon [Gammaproteobacteria bacterium]|jgi:TolB-like protein|nr:transcriptional activator of cad operon [Gammaproteobacteria bacterium]
MDGPNAATLRIGAWRVDADSGQISRDGESVRVDARLMRLLLCLAERAGKVVTTDELLQEVWSGVVVTQDSVYQAVASLRRLLGDDPKKPTYIATVPRQGYRMVATVSPWAGTAPAKPTTEVVDPPPATPLPRGVDPPNRWPRGRVGALLALGAALCLAQAASVGPPGPPHKSIAVLPFLDLTTESMDQEYFADGMTEELIDKLSRIPGLKVPSATAAFYFKGKQKTIANIAEELGVAYVVDGSLRKSGSTLRVAARLVRADNGFVVWSETYDRQSDDVLKVQDDVAEEVARALSAMMGRQ